MQAIVLYILKLASKVDIDSNGSPFTVINVLIYESVQLSLCFSYIYTFQSIIISHLISFLFVT